MLFVPDRWLNNKSAVHINSGYLTAPTGVYFSGDHTVSVWVKTLAVLSFARIIDFGNGRFDDNVVFSTSYYGTSQPVCEIFLSAYPDLYYTRLVTSSKVLSLMLWTHLAYTYANDTCKVYLNGTQTASASCHTPRNVTRTQCYVGKSNWSGNDLQNAHLDDLRIYNRSLNQTEIEQLVGYSPPGSSSASSTTTTAPKTSSSISSHVNPLFTDLFYFSSLNNSQIVELLELDYDLNGCVVNCSDKGPCKFSLIDDKFLCLCSSVYLKGDACEIDTRACSSNPCLNNATCVDRSNLSFYCSCGEAYTGDFCESRVDLCRNEACSGKGECYEAFRKAKCKCFSMYYGDRCEWESSELKTIRTVVSIAVSVAVVVIVSFYGCVALMDLTKYACNRKVFIPTRRKKPVIKRLKYKNEK